MLTVPYPDYQQRCQHTCEPSSLQADNPCFALQISVRALPVDAFAAIKHTLAYCEAVCNQFPVAVNMLKVKRPYGPRARMLQCTAWLHFCTFCIPCIMCICNAICVRAHPACLLVKQRLACNVLLVLSIPW